MFDRIGFAASTGLRLAGATLFALLAFGSVAVIEGGGDPLAITPSSTVTNSGNGRLRIEATFPVTQWTVQIQGKDVAPLSSNPQVFECELHGDLATVFIQAEPADITSTTAGALRWTFTNQRRSYSGMLWGDGLVADTIHPTAHAERSR
jgi:hypothetical protein